MSHYSNAIRTVARSITREKQKAAEKKVDARLANLLEWLDSEIDSAEFRCKLNRRAIRKQIELATLKRVRREVKKKTRPPRTEEQKCCRNCRYWQMEHGYMDCGAPDATAWDADGNCDGWEKGK